MQFSTLILLGGLFASATAIAEPLKGEYQPVELEPTVQAKIDEAIDKFVVARSVEYSGPNAGTSFQYSCNANVYDKIYCSFTYSDGGGLTGMALFISDAQGENGETFKVINGG